MLSKRVSESHSVMSDPLQPRGLYSPWHSPGQNTGVGTLSLLQGTFPTQGSNRSLLLRQADSLPLSHQGNLTFMGKESRKMWIYVCVYIH